MTTLPMVRTTYVSLPVLALGRHRGVLVLELSRRAARRSPVDPAALERAERQRDAMLALRQGAGV